MSIDWLTVAAQLVNFLVLVWLLKRFLFRPIVDGIDAREAEIAERMQVAVRAKEDAQAAETAYRAQVSTLQSEQASASEAMRRQAEQERDTLLAEAHARIAQEREAWQAHLDEEGRSFAAKLNRAGGRALLELTRKALTDLADETLEARVAAHLARQLGPMDTELQHAAGNPEDALVTSHAALPKAVQDDLATQLDHRFPDINVRFDTDQTLAPGLILRIGGAQLAWTIDTYIDGLNDLLADQLFIGMEQRA